MTVARDRLAITALTDMLTGTFDVPTVLDAVTHDACDGFDAASAVVVLLDGHQQPRTSGLHVVAEALRTPTDVDLHFVTAGPALASARGGAVTMVADLDDAGETRWPEYCQAARQAGIRGVRAFPVSVLGVPLGALVVHTGDPWGTRRPNEFGHTLANLAAIAISIGSQTDRSSDTRVTIDALLQGIFAIATATGILAELSGTQASQARLQLHRLARAHGTTATAHAEALVAAHNQDPRHLEQTGLLAAPSPLPPPPHIDA